MFTAAKISIIFQSSKLFRVIVRMMSDFFTFAPIKPRRSQTIFKWLKSSLICEVFDDFPCLFQLFVVLLHRK